jgi:hypothetical protein
VIKITKNGLKKWLANLFGSFGYLFCALQWLWAVILYYGSISSLFSLLKTENINTNVDKATVSVGNSDGVFLAIFSAIVIILILALTAYVIYKVPSTIVKTGKKVVNETAENLTPLLLKVQHKSDTKKRRYKLTTLLTLILKIIIIIIPAAASLLSRFINKPMVDYNVVIFISFWLASLSIISFCLQYLIAKIFTINRRDLW